MKKDLVKDQAGCLEDTPLFNAWRRLSGEKTVWRAERARFLDRRSRRAKPGIEPLLTRWGKSGVFLNHSAAAFHTVFSTSSLIFFILKI